MCGTASFDITGKNIIYERNIIDVMLGLNEKWTARIIGIMQYCIMAKDDIFTGMTSRQQNITKANIGY